MTVTAEEREAFLEFDATLGPNYSAELIAGRIVVNPPPTGDHDDIIVEVSDQLARLSALRVRSSGTRGLSTPSGNFIPDLTVVEPHALRGEPSWGAPATRLMVVEVTSSAPADDREAKRRAYAAVGIPLYLLIDRGRREVVLFSEPDVEGQDYRADLRVRFGSNLELPAPFSFTLTDFTPAGD